MEEIPLSVWLFIAYFAIPFTLALYYYVKRKINDFSKRDKGEVRSAHPNRRKEDKRNVL